MTIRECSLISAQKDAEDILKLEMQRNLEFTIYKTTFAGMNGSQPFKKIRKPKDLYSLPSDKRKYKPIKIDKEQMRISVEKVKQSNKFKLWQQNS